MRPCLEKSKENRSNINKELCIWPEKKKLSGVLVSHVQGSNKIT